MCGIPRAWSDGRRADALATILAAGNSDDLLSGKSLMAVLILAPWSAAYGITA